MRYAQLAKFKEIGDKGQKLLENKTVTIVGLGNIGSTVSVMLLRSGVNLRIVDKGRCATADLSGQSLYLEDDDTKFKAKQAKKHLERINPKVKVKTFHEDLNKNNVYLVDADVVVDATGDEDTSNLISDYVRKKKMPLVFALISGGQGLVAVGENGLDVAKVRPLAGKMKGIEDDGVISPAVHLASSIIVAECFRLLLKKPVGKEAFTFDAWNGTLKRQSIK